MTENYPKMMRKLCENDPKMIPKLASFASKIGWWQCFRARALGTQGYRYATMGPGPARTARKHCHQPILTLPSSSLPPPLLLLNV